MDPEPEPDNPTSQDDPPHHTLPHLNPIPTSQPILNLLLPSQAKLSSNLIIFYMRKLTLILPANQREVNLLPPRFLVSTTPLSADKSLHQTSLMIVEHPLVQPLDLKPPPTLQHDQDQELVLASDHLASPPQSNPPPHNHQDLIDSDPEPPSTVPEASATKIDSIP